MLFMQLYWYILLLLQTSILVDGKVLPVTARLGANSLDPPLPSHASEQHVASNLDHKLATFNSVPSLTPENPIYLDIGSTSFEADRFAILQDVSRPMVLLKRAEKGPSKGQQGLIPGSPIIPQSYDAVQLCLQDSMRLNEGNIIDSDWQALYSNLTIGRRNEIEEYPGNFGETAFIGEHIFGALNVECGRSYGSGCINIPDCRHIVDFYQGDMTRARPAYFLSISLVKLNMITKINDESITIALATALTLVDSIAKTFAQSEDPAAIEKCAVLRQVVQIVINLCLDVLMAASGNIIPAKSPLGIVLNEFLDKLPPIVKDMGPPALSTLGKFTLLPLAREVLESGICAEFSGDFKADHWKDSKDLKEHMHLVFDQLKMAMEKNIRDMNAGTFTEVGVPSLLATMLSIGPYSDNEHMSELLASPYEQITKTLTSRMVNDLIGRALRNYNCYIKGSHYYSGENGHESAFDLGNRDRTPLDRSRAYAEGNIVLQAQCWTMSEDGYETAIWGLDQFANPPWNINVKEMITANYWRYKAVGNQHSNWNPEKEGLGYARRESYSTLPQLPVCYSSAPDGYSIIGDFDDWRRPMHGKSLANNHAFPFSCGDWRSNDTADFLKFGGLETTGRRREGFWKIHQQYFPNSLQWWIKRPLDQYLAECAFELHYPGGRDQDKPTGKSGALYEMRYGASPWCDEMRAEIVNMSQEEANIWFCKHSPVGKKVFGHEANHVDTIHPYFANKAHYCRQWGWQ